MSYPSKYREMKDCDTTSGVVVDEKTITPEALEFLRQRLENHSFSITYTEFPLTFAEEEASASEHVIKVPLPKELSQEELMLVYAMQIHESSHVLYGSLHFDKVDEICETHKLNKRKAHFLFNIMEDYRVNTLIGVSHPGAGRIMDMVHVKLINEFHEKFGPYKTALLALCAELCGYPYKEKLNKKERAKLAEACDLIYPIVLSKDLDATLKILPEVYKIFVKDKMDDEGYSKGDGEDGEDGEAGESGDGEGEGEGDGGYSEFSSSGGGDPTGSTRISPSGGLSTTKRESHPHVDEEEAKKALEKAIKKLKERKVEPKEFKKKKETPEDSKEFRDIEAVFKEIKKIHAKAVEKEKAKLEELKKIEKYVRTEHGGKYTHRYERETNKAMYQRYVKKHQAEINKLVKEIKTMILFSKGYQSGQRSGKLNSKKAYRLLTSHDDKIFRKKIDHKDIGDLAVCLLQDVSGSMDGEKIDNARQACIILHEVFQKLKVKHMIAGYTADLSGYSTDHIMYKYWNDTATAYNLPELAAICENRDGPSVRLATGYFNQVTERNKLLIIISDGLPAAGGYGGDSGVEDTVNAQKEAMQKGIKLINIGFCYRLPHEYQNKVRVDKVKELPKALVKVLRKELLR